MKKIVVLVTLLTATSCQASSGIPQIQGKLWSNLNDDLTHYSLTVTLACTTHPIFQAVGLCGTKAAAVPILADGTFTIPALQGDNSHWDSFYYSISKDGTELLSSGNVLDGTDAKDLKSNLNNFITFTKNLTLVQIGPYPVHFTTDIGMDFTSWIANQNNGKSLGYDVRAEVVGTFPDQGAGPMTLMLQPGTLPAFTTSETEISQNDQSMSLLYLFPGTLQEVQTGIQLDVSVDSVYFGASASTQIYSASGAIPTGSTPSVNMSNPVLQTKLVNRDFSGSWFVGVNVLDEDDFDPNIKLTVACVGEVLSGTVQYTYQAPGMQSLNSTQPITGTCDSGEATFTLAFTGDDYYSGDEDPTAYEKHDINAQFVVTNVTSDQADCAMLDMSGKNIGYATFDRDQN